MCMGACVCYRVPAVAVILVHLAAVAECPVEDMVCKRKESTQPQYPMDTPPSKSLIHMYTLVVSHTYLRL